MRPGDSWDSATRETLVVEPEADILTTLAPMLADSSRLLVLNVAAEALQRIADLPEATDDLLFNARSTDIGLRDVSLSPECPAYDGVARDARRRADAV